MAHLTIDGLKRHYEMYGKGETIVLLHHGFGSTRMWKDIYPGLVQAGYCTVMYDRRGYGQSEEGPDFDQFYVSPNFRADGIKELAAVREMLGLDSFHLVGQCEGGVVAVDYATRYPEQVKSIVISSTQCYSGLPMPEWNRKRHVPGPGRIIRNRRLRPATDPARRAMPGPGALSRSQCPVRRGAGGGLPPPSAQRGVGGAAQVRAQHL
ncbi:MAG: alpha/beta fold hydrolase [Deltaproteobacteria bacterium]|nr:alpha/beta fold hydrolase [Deltaproteobacteria bacterium]